MSERDNILTELKELDSSLTRFPLVNTYQVPAGYFESFASRMLKLVKVTDVADAREELSLLSPMLTGINRNMPYAIPVSYFEGLEEKLMQGVLAGEMEQTADKELESLSPLLSGLKKENPYTVPDNYFEGLVNIAKNNAPHEKAKVISIRARKWLRVAAAAVVTGFIAIGTFLFTQKDNISPIDKSHAWVEKSLKQVSTDDLDQFIDLTDEQSPVIASVTPGKEVKELMNNISDEEIQNFLEDVKEADLIPDSGDDILLN